jgi:hypothetical protein
VSCIFFSFKFQHTRDEIADECIPTFLFFRTGTSSTPRSRAGSTKPADQKPESAKSAPKIDKKKPLALVDASTPLPSNTKRKRTPVPAVQPSSPSIPHTIEGPPPTPASVTDMDQGVFATVTLAQGGSSVTKKIRLVDSRPRPGNTTRKSPNPSASKSLFSQPYSTFSMPPPNLIPSHSAAASASTTGSAELAPQDALDDFATPRRAHSRGPPVSSSTSAEQHASSPCLPILPPASYALCLQSRLIESSASGDASKTDRAAVELGGCASSFGPERVEVERGQGREAAAGVGRE